MSAKVYYINGIAYQREERNDFIDHLDKITDSKVEY